MICGLVFSAWLSAFGPIIGMRQGCIFQPSGFERVVKAKVLYTGSHEPVVEEWREQEKRFGDVFGSTAAPARYTRMIFYPCNGSDPRVVVYRGTDPVFRGTLDASADFMLSVGETVVLDHPVLERNCVDA